MSAQSSRLTDKTPILHRSDGEICFQVDDVEPCTERLPVTEFRPKLKRLWVDLCWLLVMNRLPRLCQEVRSASTGW